MSIQEKKERSGEERRKKDVVVVETCNDICQSLKLCPERDGLTLAEAIKKRVLCRQVLQRVQKSGNKKDLATIQRLHQVNRRSGDDRRNPQKSVKGDE